MLGKVNSNGVHLPKHWPRRVRSAIVHAVSMANVAFKIGPF